MAAAAVEYMVQNPPLQRPLAQCSGSSHRAVTGCLGAHIVPLQKAASLQRPPLGPQGPPTREKATQLPVPWSQ